MKTNLLFPRHTTYCALGLSTKNWHILLRA